MTHSDGAGLPHGARENGRETGSGETIAGPRCRSRGNGVGTVQPGVRLFTELSETALASEAEVTNFVSQTASR